MSHETIAQVQALSGLRSGVLNNSDSSRIEIYFRPSLVELDADCRIQLDLLDQLIEARHARKSGFDCSQAEDLSDKTNRVISGDESLPLTE
jgi:hypothetical protein